MLGQSIFSGYLSLAIIVLVLRHVIKSSGVQMLLHSVHSYYCVDPSANPATRLKPEDLRTKKGRKQYVKQQLEIKGASEQVYRQTLSARSLQTLPFSDDINVLVTITLSLLLNSVYVVLMATLLGMETGIVTVGISLMLVVYTVVVLIKVDYAAESRKWVDNMVILLVFLVGAVAALAALLLAPKYTLQAGDDGPQVPLLAFDIRKAAQGVDALLGAMHERVAQRMKNDVPAPPRMDPIYMSVAVAVWAGMLAVAMLGPAMQYSKLLYRSMQIPSWGEPYMTRGWGTIKLMQLGFIMPIAMTVSQIPALVVYWGLDMDHSQVIAGVLLLLVALVHYLATAPLCQSYLDAGLAEWHTLLHNGYDFEGKMGVVRVRLDLLRALLGKTCVQLVSPALVACSLGLLLMLNAGLTQQAAHRLAEPRAAILARLPPGLSAVLTYRASGGASSNASTTFGLGNLTTAGSATDTLTNPSHPISDSAAALPADSASVHVGQVEEEGLFGLTEDGSTVALQVDMADKHSSKPSSKVEGAEEGKVKMLGSPSQLWLFLGHFLGWWSCLVWSVYACCSLTVYRMGLNSG